MANSTLAMQVATIFKEAWATRAGQKVPEPNNLKLGNDAIEFDAATILYADLTGSTKLVDAESWMFAAEIYKAYLHCAATIIRTEDGSIVSYDGDRIMGVFIGKAQATLAAKAGLKINYAVQEIINPALTAQYPNRSFIVSQVVGIDTSPVRAARTGVRGDNDLVWVGRAANYAAKLTELKSVEKTWMTKATFDRLADDARLGGPNNRPMWKAYKWTSMNNQSIYGSTWRMSV
jgi:class 3 adenylate cyclase